MNTWDPLKAAVSLFEESRRLQQQNKAILVELQESTRRHQAAVSRYEAICATLPERIAHQVESILPHVAHEAAGNIASKWTAANEHADLATETYKRVIRFTPRRILWLALGCALVGIGSMTAIGIWVLPNGATNANMRIEEARLSKTIEAIRKYGGDAAITFCNDRSGRQRLCVQIDETAKIELKGYRVIRGY